MYKQVKLDVSAEIGADAEPDQFIKLIPVTWLPNAISEPLMTKYANIDENDQSAGIASMREILEETIIDWHLIGFDGEPLRKPKELKQSADGSFAAAIRMIPLFLVQKIGEIAMGADGLVPLESATRSEPSSDPQLSIVEYSDQQA